MFTTYYRDYEAEGNDYAQARTYVGGLGRFSSPDPISGSASDPQSLNRYSYVRNLPVVLSDPYGLTPQCNTVKNGDSGQSQDSKSGGGPLATEADPQQQNGCGQIDCNYTVEGCPIDGGGGSGGGGEWGTGLGGGWIGS